MFQVLVSAVFLLTRGNLNAKWVLADIVDIVVFFHGVHLNTKALICMWEEALLSGWAARHQLQVYKIISHFQTLLLSHSGCLFFAKTNRAEVDNKPSISQSENEFLNVENQGSEKGVFWRICATRPNILSLSLFFLQSIYAPLKHKHCGECKSTRRCLDSGNLNFVLFCCMPLDCCTVRFI